MAVVPTVQCLVVRVILNGRQAPVFDDERNVDEPLKSCIRVHVVSHPAVELIGAAEAVDAPADDEAVTHPVLGVGALQSPLERQRLLVDFADDDHFLGVAVEQPQA